MINKLSFNFTIGCAKVAVNNFDDKYNIGIYNFELSSQLYNNITYK